MRRRAVLQNAINQSTNQSINWPNDRSINRSISQSINWPIEQANKHPIDQSIDQPIEQSNNWSIDQPINQSFDQFLWRKNGMARPWKLWSSALSNSLLRLFHWGGFVEQCRGSELHLAQPLTPAIAGCCHQVWVGMGLFPTAKCPWTCGFWCTVIHSFQCRYPVHQ